MLASEHIDAVYRARRAAGEAIVGAITGQLGLMAAAPSPALAAVLDELGALAAVWEAECDRLAALLDDALDLECPTCGT